MKAIAIHGQVPTALAAVTVMLGLSQASWRALLSGSSAVRAGRGEQRDYLTRRIMPGLRSRRPAGAAERSIF